MKPLQQQVKDAGLWACHLGPELGGQGYGQVKLALLNELLGRTRWAPSVFGAQAPDSGNAEILAHYGTDEQKARFLQPLLDGEISSCYSMTEPHAGADPTLFETTAVRDGDEWVINGYKWFSSNARFASFYITMVVTNTEVSAYQGMSMFIIPADTPGIKIIRNVGVGTEPESEASHGYLHYENLRVPADHLLGGEGQGFVIAQTRLGGGISITPCAPSLKVKRAFDMMCERALSRETRHGRSPRAADDPGEGCRQLDPDPSSSVCSCCRPPAHRQAPRTTSRSRHDIAAVKAAMPTVYFDVVQRAMQLHGALGISNEMPFSSMMVGAPR
ncbi:MAG: acyl-CoA dehydrogenase family protein [Acidimicrobiales bacterium]